MRVLYGYKRQPGTCIYELIYDKYHDVGEPIKMKKHIVTSEREVTNNERDRIVFKMGKPYRIYEYDTIEHLVDDELNMFIITPIEVIENFKTNEKSSINR